MKINMINKIVGLILCAIGAGIGYLEYLIICGINGIGIWITSAVGLTGAAATGVGLLVYVPVIGLLLGMIAVIAICLWVGVALVCK